MLYVIVVLLYNHSRHLIIRAQSDYNSALVKRIVKMTKIVKLNSAHQHE